MARERRKNSTNHRYLRVHPNRTFNDWDVIEHQLMDATTVDLTEIEEHLTKLDNEQEEQNTNIETNKTNIETKQDKLIAGDNITIENNVISATGSTEEKHIYQHTFFEQKIVANLSYIIMSNSATPPNMYNWLKNNGYNISDDDPDMKYYPATGTYEEVNSDIHTLYPVIGIVTKTDNRGTAFMLVYIKPGVGQDTSSPLLEDITFSTVSSKVVTTQLL